MEDQNTNKEILEQLKKLNSAIEDYLDNLDMADSEEEDIEEDELAEEG